MGTLCDRSGPERINKIIDEQNNERTQFNWIELNWIELNWIEFNGLELNSIEFNWIEFNWIQFKFNWIEFNWIEFNWIQRIQLNSIESNWIQLNCIQLNSIELNSIENAGQRPQSERINNIVHLIMLICSGCDSWLVVGLFFLMCYNFPVSILFCQKRMQFW